MKTSTPKQARASGASKAKLLRKSKRRFSLALPLLLLICAPLTTIQCASPLDLCVNEKASFGFFSKGDCILTRSSFFQGHEWLTYFANRSLPAEQRFSDEEIVAIAEGNRRVDWPKEFLVHMNNSVLSYTNALVEYTDRPENQRYHFLLTDTNTSEEAARDSYELMVENSRIAIQRWSLNRISALTYIGKVNHVMQDSFSGAHTVREPNNTSIPWCVRKVKAYIRRKPGYEDPSIEFHGGTDEDSIGHTTTEDSIYREGRDCHDPQASGDVESCLNDQAKRAIVATADYLKVMNRLLRSGKSAEELETEFVAEMEVLRVAHYQLCPEP